MIVLELFLEAEKDYEEKRFHSAYRGYRRCLEKHKVDKKTMFACCQKIVSLGESLGISGEESMERLLADSFFHLGEYARAIGHGEAAIAKRKSRENYEILWESCFRQGNLAKAETVAESYLAYCRNKHLCDLGLSFIEKLKEKGLSGGSLAIIGMELEIIRGNKEVVLGRLAKLERMYDEDKAGFREMAYEINCYQDWINSYKKYWESENVVRSLFLKHWRECLGDNEILETDIIERKKIIYFVLVDYLLEGKEFGETLEVYVQVFERESLSVSMDEYKNKKCSSGNKVDPFEGSVELDLEKNIAEKSVSNVIGKIRSHHVSSVTQYRNNIEIFFEGLSDDFLVDNAGDLLVCLIEMELYEGVLSFVDKMRDKIKQKSMEYQINIAYMEIVALEKSGKYYQALDYIDDTLNSLPLKVEERGAFLKEKKNLKERVDLPKETM